MHDASEPLSKSICIKVLENPEIAQDILLSNKIIDAAVQWRYAFDEKYDDLNVLTELATINFSQPVLQASIPIVASKIVISLFC